MAKGMIKDLFDRLLSKKRYSVPNYEKEKHAGDEHVRERQPKEEHREEVYVKEEHAEKVHLKEERVEEADAYDIYPQEEDAEEKRIEESYDREGHMEDIDIREDTEEKRAVETHVQEEPGNDAGTLSGHGNEEVSQKVTEEKHTAEYDPMLHRPQRGMKLQALMRLMGFWFVRDFITEMVRRRLQMESALRFIHLERQAVRFCCFIHRKRSLMQA